MLIDRRPFHDWGKEPTTIHFIDSLMQERYCDLVAPAAQAIAAAAIDDEPEPEPDYIFTRRGIETILFYAGYLAWNGPPDQHPLIADWQENLAWLRRHQLDDYNKTYTQ